MFDATASSSSSSSSSSMAVAAVGVVVVVVVLVLVVLVVVVVVVVTWLPAENKKAAFANWSCDDSRDAFATAQCARSFLPERMSRSNPQNADV